MIEVGRLAVKTSGRDAGKQAVVVDILDDNNVLIDGATRRRKCNVNHLFLLNKKLDIKKNASHEDIEKEFKKIKLEVLKTKPKPKTQRPRKKRKTTEELRAQKEEKKKVRALFKKKAEEKSEKKVDTLEEKAGLEAKTEDKEVKKAPVKKVTKVKKEVKSKEK